MRGYAKIYFVLDVEVHRTPQLKLDKFLNLLRRMLVLDASECKAGTKVDGLTH